MTFNPEDKRIINVLYIAHKIFTTKNIYERSEMAWQTAKKYMGKLYDKGVVNRGRHGKSVY